MATPETYFNFGLLIAVFLVGVPGNFITLRAFWTGRARLLSVDIIMTLASSDAIVCLLVVPYQFYYLYMDAYPDIYVNYELQYFLCKAGSFFMSSIPAFSCLLVAFVAVDRFFAIRFPLKKPSQRYRLITLCVLLLISASFAIAVATIQVLEPRPQQNISNNETNSTSFEKNNSSEVFFYCTGAASAVEQAYILLYFHLSLFYAAIVICIVCYVALFCFIRMRMREQTQKRKKNTMVLMKNGLGTEVIPLQPNPDQTGTTQSTSVKKETHTKVNNVKTPEMRVAITLALVTGVFVITFIPSSLITLDWALPGWQTTWYILHLTHSAVNPLIYLLTNPRFRCEVRRMSAITSCHSSPLAKTRTYELNKIQLQGDRD